MADALNELPEETVSALNVSRSTAFGQDTAYPVPQPYLGLLSLSITLVSLPQKQSTTLGFLRHYTFPSF